MKTNKESTKTIDAYSMNMNLFKYRDAHVRSLIRPTFSMSLSKNCGVFFLIMLQSNDKWNVKGSYIACLPLWELRSKWNQTSTSNVRISFFAKIKRQLQLRIKKSKVKNQKKSNHFLQKSEKSKESKNTSKSTNKKMCGQVFMFCLKIAFREALCAVAVPTKKKKRFAFLR